MTEISLQSCEIFSQTSVLFSLAKNGFAERNDEAALGVLMIEVHVGDAMLWLWAVMVKPERKGRSREHGFALAVGEFALFAHEENDVIFELDGEIDFAQLE